MQEAGKIFLCLRKIRIREIPPYLYRRRLGTTILMYAQHSTGTFDYDLFKKAYVVNTFPHKKKQSTFFCIQYSKNDPFPVYLELLNMPQFIPT